MPPTLAALAARLRARGRGEVLELPVSRLRELEGGRGEVALRLAEGLQVTRIGELLDALGDGEDSPQLEGREARLKRGRLIHALLSVVFEAADSAWDPDISRHLVALFNFMQGKEFAGQERATGAALFATGCADADGQQRLLRLIESQEQCLQVFADFASRPLQLAWQQAQKPDTLATLERLRRVLCTTTPGGALESHLSQAWFDVCTAHMDAMKSVEDAMAAELLSLCKRRRQTAEEDLRALEDLQTRVPEAGALVADTAFFDDAPASPGLPLMDLPHQAASFGAQMDRSILEIVRDQALRLQAMGDELDTVRSSLNERKLVERAKGLLMAHRQLSEDEAHKALRQMAMNQNRRLIEVADAVLAMAEVLPNPSPR